MKKKLSLVLGLSLAALVPAGGVALAKPTPAKLPKGAYPTKKAPTPSGPSSGGGASTSGDTTATGGTHPGVMSSMLVDKSGEISELYLKIAGNVATVRIKGCGAKSEAHPLLNWVFTEKRLVYITTDDSGCLSNVLIPR